MKQALVRLLAVFGLAPARVVAAQTSVIQEARAASQAWKAKAGEALARVEALQAEVKRQAQENRKLQLSSEKSRRRQDELEQLLRIRLDEAERQLGIACEQLMLIDVKLDTLEGAANILDGRTRATISALSNETVTPV